LQICLQYTMEIAGERETDAHEDEVVLEFKRKWISEQNLLKKQLILTDEFPWKLNSFKNSAPVIPSENQKDQFFGDAKCEISSSNQNASFRSRDNEAANQENYEDLHLIGGVDISFVKDNPIDACASLIVLKYPSFQIVYSNFKMVKLKLPYIPSFLAFREVSFLMDLLNELRTTKPHLVPQVILVDGNGILHPRGFGLASHLGVLSGIPTIGVGKTFFHVDGITTDKVKEMEKQLQHGGSHVELVGESGTVWGSILRSTESSQKGIYVSQGHKISLETAVKVVQACCLYRIPEPVRQADLQSRQFIRDHYLEEDTTTNTEATSSSTAYILA